MDFTTRLFVLQDNWSQYKNICPTNNPPTDLIIKFNTIFINPFLPVDCSHLLGVSFFYLRKNLTFRYSKYADVDVTEMDS